MVAKADWRLHAHKLQNLVDDDDSSSDSGSIRSDDGDGPVVTTTAAFVTASLAAVPVAPQQRRSRRVPLREMPPATTKKKAPAIVTPMKLKKSVTKKKTAVVVPDAESSSDSSSSGSEDEKDEEARGRAKKKKPLQKKNRTSAITTISSPKMSRQRDHSARATKKNPTVTNEAASADAKEHAEKKAVEKVLPTKETRKAAKMEHAVVKKVTPAIPSDSGESDSDNDSKRKKSVKVSKAESAASAIAMARKREVAAKERADRAAPSRAPSAVQRNALAEVIADPVAQRIRLQWIPSNDSIKPEYEVARSRSSSASRKRPLPSPKVRADDDQEAAEKKPSSADRDRSTASNERTEPKAATKENGESVSSNKASITSKREATKKKQLSQEEQDHKLALALATRKSDRPRRRTGSEDTLDNMKRETPADERSKKRKRAGSNAASAAAVAELSKADVQKPMKRVRKTSVDAGSVDPPKASGKLKSPKKSRKDTVEVADVVLRAKSGLDEKLTTPRKKPRKSSQDLSATRRHEGERDEVLSKKRREQEPVIALAFEGITDEVKPARLRLGSKSRPDGNADVGKKHMLGSSTPSRKEKERDEMQPTKRRERRNSLNMEFEWLRKVDPEQPRGADEPVIDACTGGASSVAEPTKATDAVTSEPVTGNFSEKKLISSENDSKLPVLAEEGIAVEETKRESTYQVAGEIQENFADPDPKKQATAESVEVKPEPVKKVLIEDDGEKEEGEEDEEEGAIVDDGAAAATNDDAPKQDPSVDVKVEKKSGDCEDKPVADPVDLMSFVIPKKKIRKTADSYSARVPASSSLPPVINASIRRTPASSPLPRELEVGKSKSGKSRFERDERVIPRRRRRTKNSVPVSFPVLTRPEIDFMHLARKVNSLMEACRRTHAVATGTNASAGVGPYDIVDSSGSLIPDFIPRMKCPTKKQMKTQTDQFPSPFFGVLMTLPSAAEPAEDAIADQREDFRNQPEASRVDINTYEPLVFERREDREAYLKKMYGTAFVPQLLRGRTSLIMRNVRYERKSTGFQFNTDRDREEFAKSLSERYTMNKSVPRCEIPPKNWQQLQKKMSAVVYLHYMNKEDCELAAQRFYDDNGIPLERKRTNRVGGTINSSSASNSPAPQLTPSRSRSTERSVPESSPVVARKETVPRESSQGARSWQPYHDEQRPSERREDWNGSSSGRAPREWPPRYSDLRGDRRPERIEESRGDRRSDQRYGSNDGERTGSQRPRRRRGGRSRTRSRSRSCDGASQSQPQSQSVREFDENYWPSDNGRRDGDGENSDFHDSQAANSAEETSDNQGESMSRLQSSQCDRSRSYSKIKDSEANQRVENRGEDADGHRDRTRSESLGKENRDYSSDSKYHHDSHNEVEMEDEGSVPREHDEPLDRDVERSRSPEQDQPDGEHEDNCARRRGFVGDDRRQHRGEEFNSSRGRDGPYHHQRNDYDNENQDADRVHLHDGNDFEYAGHDRHPRRHSRSRSRSHPRHLNHADRLDRSRERGVHQDRDFGHDRDGGGGHFGGEFDDRNGGGFNYPHGHYERDRPFQRHGGRGGDEYARQQRHHHPY